MNVEKIIEIPSNYFSEPDDILITESLDTKQKMEALENWKQICMQLQTSTSEGMPGESQAESLRLVSEAIRNLRRDELN